MDNKGSRTVCTVHKIAFCYKKQQSNVLDKENLDLKSGYLLWKSKTSKRKRGIKNNLYKANERRTGRVVSQCEDMLLLCFKWASGFIKGDTCQLNIFL